MRLLASSAFSLLVPAALAVTPTSTPGGSSAIPKPTYGSRAPHSITTKRTSTTTSSTSTSTSTAPTASATPWIIQSKSGRSKSAFTSLLEEKVENYDSITFISFPNFDLFRCFFELHHRLVTEESLVKSVEENSANESSDFEKASPYNGNAKREVPRARDREMERRAKPVTVPSPGFVPTSVPEAAHLLSQVDSPAHLKMLSNPSKGQRCP